MTVQLHGWWVDTARGIDLSRPIRFGDPAPRPWGMSPAASRPVEADGFIGDTDQGGSVNCHRLCLIAHTDGTHTETWAHLDTRGPSVSSLRLPPLMPVAVWHVPARRLSEAGETGTTGAEGMDAVITAAELKAAQRRASVKVPDLAPQALLVLCEESDPGVLPPYLTEEAMAWLSMLPVLHLLLDVPSVDRLLDGGALANHRRWWGLDPVPNALPRHPARTITELVARPATLPAEGLWALHLQVPAMDSDAAPSRPVLYPLSASAPDS
jgi:kynurenine formamidase